MIYIYITLIKVLSLLDGWTSNDLIYIWTDNSSVKMAGNLSLPGGFKMADIGQNYCDVTTATGNQ